MIESISVFIPCPVCGGDGAIPLDESDSIDEDLCRHCAGTGRFATDVGLNTLAIALADLPDETLVRLAERLLRAVGLGALIEQAAAEMEAAS